jgi:hypothetical protein
MISICIQRYDPAFGRVPRAARRKPTHCVGTRAYNWYVEETDDAANKGI